MLPDFKIMVKNNRESAVLQDILFTRGGVRWLNGSTEIKPALRRFLCEEGWLSWLGETTWDFLDCRTPEKTFDEVFFLLGPVPTDTSSKNSVPDLQKQVSELTDLVKGLEEFVVREFGRHEQTLTKLQGAPKEPPTKKIGWLNIYAPIVVGSPGYAGAVWSTKLLADKNAKSTRIACIKVEWEEL